MLAKCGGLFVVLIEEGGERVQFQSKVVNMIFYIDKFFFEI